MTIHDCWNTIVEKKGLELDGTRIYFVDATEIKTLCNHAEPRRVAKMDRRRDLPSSLRGDPSNPKGRYFVLPVRFARYALVPGDGYHNLENIELVPEDFPANRQVPHTVALQNGESAAVWTALYTGLLDEVVEATDLRNTFHNDRHRMQRTPISYSTLWKNLDVDGAQIEVDACFEDTDEICIFESKAWDATNLHDFNVRQLFYPFWYVRNHLEAIGVKARTRLFFLNFEPGTRVYRWWEYEFETPNDYSTLTKRRQGAHRIIGLPQAPSPSLIRAFLSESELTTTYVPQANDVAKIPTLAGKVKEGVTTKEELRRYFDFDVRQSHYYAEAAEELGYVERPRGKPYALTEQGSGLTQANSPDATDAIVRKALSLPLLRHIAEVLASGERTSVSQAEVAEMIPTFSRGRYHGNTALRRAQCVVRWFQWIGEATGIFVVRDERIFAGSGPSE